MYGRGLENCIGVDIVMVFGLTSEMYKDGYIKSIRVDFKNCIGVDMGKCSEMEFETALAWTW
eukprot:12412161-Karenia_brevis.AAC.1